MIEPRTRKDLLDVLMEPKEKGVKEPYFVIRGDHQNITVLSSGKNGTEFNKTYGHFHNYLGIEIYHCLFGQGVLIMQRNNEEGDAKEFKVVTLHPNKQVEIPSGFGHCLVNIGKDMLVVLDNAPNTPRSHNFEPVKDKRGFAYYIVEKKGEIAFEMNPLYRIHPQISTE